MRGNGNILINVSLKTIEDPLAQSRSGSAPKNGASPAAWDKATRAQNIAQRRRDEMTLAQDSEPHTRAELLAHLFRHRAGQWLDGRLIAKAGGAYAWRTRISDLRRAPFFMRIENRQRRVAPPGGDTYVVSEYRFVPENLTGRDA